MSWLWICLITWFIINIGAKSNDLLLMTSTKCITNSTLPLVTNSVLTNKSVIENLPKDSLLFNVTITLAHDGNYWEVKNSTEELIRDYRWEEFPTYHSSGREENISNFLTVPYFINSTNFTIPISIRADEAHIRLCTNDREPECIWFMLHGFEGTKSFIRFCKEKDIKNGSCTGYAKQIKHQSAKILSGKFWGHILLKKEGLKWTIFHERQDFINHTYEGRLLDFKNLKVFAKAGLFKIHRLTYFYSKFIGETFHVLPKDAACLKMFIKMCEDCTLNIAIKKDGNLIFNRTYKESTWTEIKVSIPNTTFSKISFEKSSGASQEHSFWAVSNIIYCSEYDIRNISRSNDEGCELVNGLGNRIITKDHYNINISKTEKIYYEPKFYNILCPNNKCEDFKFCTDLPELACYCPPGFLSASNNIKCTNQTCGIGFYGHDCVQACKGCYYGCTGLGQCIKVKDSMCKINYTGPNCELEFDQASSIYLNWDDDNKMIVSWNHPNMSSETYTTKIEYMSNNFKDTKDIMNNNSYFSLPSHVSPESFINITISICTNSKCSFYQEYNGWTPPRKAIIKNHTFQFTAHNDTIDVTLPDIEKNCVKCNTTILVALNRMFIDDFNNYIIFAFGGNEYPKLVLVGNGSKMFSQYLNKTLINPPLQLASYYNLSIQVINQFNKWLSVTTKFWIINTKGVIHSHKNLLDSLELNMTTIILIAASILGALLIGVIICIIKWKCSSKTAQTSTIGQGDEQILGKENSEALALLSLTRKFSETAVPVSNYENHLKQLLDKNILEEKFQGLFNENFESIGNTVPNLITYYNAYFLSDMNTENSYLVAETPSKKHVDAFVKLIWEYNVRNIIAIANTSEETNMEYWPRLNKTIKIGKIEVSCINEEEDFHLRTKTLTLKNKRQERQIIYIYFASWKYRTSYLSQNVILLLEKMNNIKLCSNSPILVYSSDSSSLDSAVEIIVLTDMNFRMARKENTTNVTRCLVNARIQNKKFIDTSEKFLYVHLLLFKCLFSTNTSIAFEIFDKTFKRMKISSTIDRQFQNISERQWIDCQLVRKRQSLYSEIIHPVAVHQHIYLKSGDLKNFACLNGFFTQNQLFAMSYPTNDKIDDFWNFIIDSNASIIVTINHPSRKDTNMKCFWPEKTGKICINETTTVTCERIEHCNSYQVFDLNICINKTQFPLKLYVFKNWGKHDVIPESYEDILSFITQVSPNFNIAENIIVNCSDGITGCGLFIGLYFLLDMIKTTQICDICTIVRYIRYFNRHFINKRQFEYLYEASSEYLPYLNYDNLTV